MKKDRMKRFSVIFILGFILFFSTQVISAETTDDLFQITVIDVGKGDCILVQTGESTVMIDTGYKETANEVLNYLNEHNITKLDALIISHFHKDHVGGGAAILRKITPDRLYMPDYDGTRDVYIEMLQVIEDQQITPNRLTGDDGVFSFTLSSGAEFRLYPSTVPYDGNEENDNDVSMAAAVYYNGHSAFFAGDLEDAGLTSLLDYAKDDPQALKCDILKLPHHGRTSDNSSALLDLADPEIALITDGSGERAYGEMIDMLNERNIRYLCSASDGTYIVTADDSGYTSEKSKGTDNKTSGVWNYTVLENGTAAITGYTGSAGQIKVPSSVDGLTVSRIADSAFYNHTELTSVTIPESVSEIGDSAFSWCRNLKKIQIPEQLTSLGSGAFAFCEKLEHIDIPEGVTAIGAYTFFRCYVLDDVKLPDGLRSIGEKAFAHCKSLREITIPSGVKTIEEEAFRKCSRLKTVIIQPGVKNIKKSVFEECTGLESVWIPSSIKSIKGNAFKNCSNLTDIYYEGTEEMWNAIEDRAKSWDKNTPQDKQIHFEAPAPEPEEIIPVPDDREDFFPLPEQETVLPATGITAGMLPTRPAELKYSDLGLTIGIPSVSSAAQIVEVPLSGTEYPVTWLGHYAGLLEGSAFPGEGTSIIVGHNHLDQQEAGPFAFLRFVSIGDRIFIGKDDGTAEMIYSVFANEKIAETDFAALESICSSRENTLILMTCEDEQTDGGYENRRIIAAEPVPVY